MANNRNYNEKDDREEKANESAMMFKLNSQWLEEQEAYNLGGKRLPRNGENSVYTNTGIGKNPDGTHCALPSGLPIPFSNPNFQSIFRNDSNLKICFPAWDFSCTKMQDLSNSIADPDYVSEVIKGCIEKLRKSGSIRISTGYRENR